MDEVMENRNAPGNGLDEKTGAGRLPGPGTEEENVPLKPYSEPLPAFNEAEMEGDEKESDKLSSCATKCRLTPKKGHIYLILCGILIFLLLIILIVLIAFWPTSYSNNTCSSSECHQLAAQILGRGNYSISPCEDFWEFTCGGWLKENPIPRTRSHWSTAAAEELRVKEKIRALINTHSVRNEVNSVDLKVKRFYQSCMGVEYIEADKDRALKIIIDSLGGWEVLRTFRPNDFNFRRTLQTLQAEYRISPFFSIKVVSDPRRPTKSMIHITPDGLSLPDKSYYFKQKDPVATAFHYYAKDVVQLLGATSDAAIKFAEDIFEYEKRIARITPDVLNLTDPVMNFHILTVSQLKSKSNTIFWDDLLKGIFPQGHVHDLTEVLVPSIKYLVDVSNVISATDPQILNNYLMWHLTSKYSIYLHKPFRDLYYIFQKDTTGSLEPLDRWEFCVEETIKFFPHGINDLLSRNCDRRDEKREKIEVLFENLKGALTAHLTESSIPESWINFAIEKLRLMSIQVGTPIRNSSILVDLYLPIVSQRDYFFTNVISATAFSLKQEQVDLASLPKDATTLWALAKSPFRITFIPTTNKILVPESVLQNSLLLSPRSHLPIIYGSIGVQLAEAIVRAFGPEDGLFLSNGALMQEHDPKVAETRELIESKRVCLSSFFTSIRLDDAPYIERTSLDSLLHLGGIQVALDAFQSLDLTFPSLPSLQEFNSNAIFFIAYGQSQCSASTLAFHDLEHITFTSLSTDHRTKGLLRQMVGFTRSLGCSRWSEMYSDFSCGYFI